MSAYSSSRAVSQWTILMSGAALWCACEIKSFCDFNTTHVSCQPLPFEVLTPRLSRVVDGELKIRIDKLTPKAVVSGTLIDSQAVEVSLPPPARNESDLSFAVAAGALARLQPGPLRLLLQVSSDEANKQHRMTSGTIRLYVPPALSSPAILSYVFPDRALQISFNFNAQLKTAEVFVTEEYRSAATVRRLSRYIHGNVTLTKDANFSMRPELQNRFYDALLTTTPTIALIYEGATAGGDKSISKLA